MSENISKLFSDFIKLFTSKNKINKNYLDFFNVLKDDKTNYEKNRCNFLDSEKIYEKIEEYLCYNEELYYQTYYKLSKDNTLEINHDTATEIQFKDLVNYIDNLNINTFINSNDNTKYLIKKIESELGLALKDIKLKNLRTFCQLIYSKYFENLLINFIKDYHNNQENIDYYTAKLKKWKKYHGTIFDNSDYDAAESFYPHSYLTYNKTFGFKKGDIGTSLKIVKEYEISIEQSNIFDVPNIQIFCSSLDNTQEIIPFVYNRFVFLHEFGHNICFVPEKEIKINNKVYTLKNSEGKWRFDNKIFDDIKSELSADEKKLAKRYKIDKIYNDNKNTQAILDIGADYLAITIIVNELEILGIKPLEILKIIANISKNLSGDEYHFDANTRFYLNIYTNKLLLETYDSNVTNGGPDIYKDISSLIDGIKLKIIKNAGSTNTTKCLNNIVQVLNPDYQEILEQKIDIIELYYKETDDYYKKNISKIIQFFEDASSIMFDDSDSTYMKKYLKYKKKYLELKKLNY